MRRKALLIGNTSGLPGVKVDLEHFQYFLKSDTGGAWIDKEIEIVKDTPKATLVQKIALMKLQSLDYVIVMFSGHGGQVRETVLELNAKGEKIEESQLLSISQRQLTIFDCCRCYPDIKSESRSFAASEYKVIRKSQNIREKYDRRILSAIPQQCRLYSCSIDEVSYDSKEGGIYLKNFLRAANSVVDDYKLVGVAHQQAEKPTYEHSLLENDGPQNPDAKLPKCLTSQQLIISINA